jgi:hypothetical protein
MKKLVVICVVVMFLFAGYSYSQDCGKCPAKASCAKAKIKKDKPQPNDPIVLVTQADKKFHKTDCPLVKDKIKVKLSLAKKKGFEPCPKCFPPEIKKIEPEKK